MTNTTEQGKEREREFLAYIELSQKSEDLPTVRDPDFHIDADSGQLGIFGKKFDFSWQEEGVLVEIDGGQWKIGGGRHNRDEDRWKTLNAQAAGWRVLHISYTMLKQNPARILEILAEILR